MNLDLTKPRQGHKPGLSRRGFLTRMGVAAAGALLLPSADAFAKALSRERRITLYNANTSEEWSYVASPRENYDNIMLSTFNHFLRDHRAEEVHIMDPALLDLLYAVTVLTGGRGEYTVISGYRSPETNQMLRKMGHGVAEHSLHMRGKAIDLRTPDVSSRDIREAGLALQQGGVGYYHAADFVHLDTGDVRSW